MLARSLMNLLYPPVCVLCHARLVPQRTERCEEAAASDRLPDILCAECEARLPRNTPPVCRTCGVALRGAFDAESACPTCRRRPPAFEVARAPWRYEASAREAIRLFKYRRHRRLGWWLAEGMAQTAQRTLAPEAIDLVVPTPSHWLKRRLRGFEPTAELAQTVARRLSRPYAAKALTRRRWTRSQTRLSWPQRARNVRGAFGARTRLVAQRTILLVDDVLTSGATVEACAEALKAAGATRVLVVTAARTPWGSSLGPPASDIGLQDA